MLIGYFFLRSWITSSKMPQTFALHGLINLSSFSVGIFLWVYAEFQKQ